MLYDGLLLIGVLMVATALFLPLTGGEALGVRGYTITEARGKGSRGRRQSDWAQEGNIRIEIVCDGALAERVAARLRERYYDHYAMIVFLQDVSVLRPDKF